MYYEWKKIEKDTIISHINKHILNDTNDQNIVKEVEKWQELLGDDFSKMISDYRNEFNKNNTKLYKMYDNIAKKLIDEHLDEEDINVYIYKSKGSYSCNFSSNNQLTTCTKLNFKSAYSSRLTILSCFFRTSFSRDSEIFGTLNNIKNNGFYLYSNNHLVIKGLKSNNKRILQALYTGVNDLSIYGGSLDDVQVLSLLTMFNFLFNQYKYYGSMGLSDHRYYYYLLKKISQILNIESYKSNLSTLVAPTDDMKEKTNLENMIKSLKQISRVMDTELEYFIDELSLLLVCYYCMEGCNEDIVNINHIESVEDNLDLFRVCFVKKC